MLTSSSSVIPGRVYPSEFLFFCTPLFGKGNETLPCLEIINVTLHNTLTAETQAWAQEMGQRSVLCP